MDYSKKLLKTVYIFVKGSISQPL